MKRLLPLLLALLTVLRTADMQADQGNPSTQASTSKAAASGGGANGLLTSLAAYWKLDEGSGTTREDAHSNNQDLTDSGTTAAATGKLNDGADFENSSPTHLLHADSATLSLGADQDFAITFWAKFEAFTGFQDGIISKEVGNDGTTDEFGVYMNGLQQVTFRVGNGTTFTNVSETTLNVPSTATWYFFVVQHNSTADTLSIQSGTGSTLGTAITVTYTHGTQDTGAAFWIGAKVPNVNLAIDGVIDEVGYWKRTLSGADVTALFNGGTPLPYSSFD